MSMPHSLSHHISLIFLPKGWELCPTVCITPKLHYMSIFQRILKDYLHRMHNYNNHNYFILHVIYMYRFGPPVRYWCMRMEAKNGYTKKLLAAETSRIFVFHLVYIIKTFWHSTLLIQILCKLMLTVAQVC